MCLVNIKIVTINFFKATYCINSNYDIKENATIIIDGEKYKPDTWYTLKDGEFVEVRDECAD